MVSSPASLAITSIFACVDMEACLLGVFRMRIRSPGRASLNYLQAAALFDHSSCTV